MIRVARVKEEEKKKSFRGHMNGGKVEKREKDFNRFTSEIEREEKQ